jgi:hypothetical protein
MTVSRPSQKKVDKMMGIVKSHQSRQLKSPQANQPRNRPTILYPFIINEAVLDFLDGDLVCCEGLYTHVGPSTL